MEDGPATGAAEPRASTSTESFATHRTTRSKLSLVAHSLNIAVAVATVRSHASSDCPSNLFYLSVQMALSSNAAFLALFTLFAHKLSHDTTLSLRSGHKGCLHVTVASPCWGHKGCLHVTVASPYNLNTCATPSIQASLAACQRVWRCHHCVRGC